MHGKRRESSDSRDQPARCWQIPMLTTCKEWPSGGLISASGTMRLHRGRGAASGDRRDEFGASGAAFVSDDVVDRFAIVGPPEEHVRRLTELGRAGVDQFNLYLMSGDEEKRLEAYGSTIIPALKAALDEA
jgi:alkanesulfonate monooxygenase SsuD/methylene tetrahydromethanopterin reductase-like flavin-dependent oxidoreductase (luciferase family)